MSFQKSIRSETLACRIVFELAFIRTLHGPSFRMLPGEGSGATSALLEWTIWGYFEENRGDWGPIVKTLFHRLAIWNGPVCW